MLRTSCLTFLNARVRSEKGKVLKRPSIMKRPSQMPSSEDAAAVVVGTPT